MAENNNTSQVDTNITSKPALVTDLNSSYISKEQYSHARNVVRNSKDGDLGSLGNEPSNEKCYSAPYKIIGIVPLPDDQEFVCSTNNISSEIGIGDRKKCTYRKLTDIEGLNFNTGFPIMGVAKKMFRKGIVVTFTDKRNPVRRIEIDKPVTNVDEILLFKKIEQPHIVARKGMIGNVPNGSYSVCIAYSVDNQIFSDYYSITNRIQLYSETNNNSIEIEINNLDSEFKYYSLIVVGNYIDPVNKGATKLAKVIGEYSTKTKKISVTDFINTSYVNIPLKDLVIKKRTWEKAGIISSNSNYLMLADLVARPEENYQLKAMSIEAEYVVEQVEADYYEKEGYDVGYYRDENYDFRIHGITATGEETEGFHIPGRRATGKDKMAATGADVYEYEKDYVQCEEVGKVPLWKVVNTAGDLIPYNEEFSCNRRTLGRGKLGYHESTELYADNTDMFGDNANTPIRFHRFPDESKVPRTSTINGKTYINILGIRFKSIPKFDSPDIVGYKIVRSDRKGGNGTVIARGLMTNIRSYVDSALNQTVLYSNYTVNDLSPDQFISSTQTRFRNGREELFNPLTTYHKDRFTFYSPHTHFEPRYSLGNEVKIECEEIASVKGKFEKVYKHPKAKLMNQFAFWLSCAVGFVESTLTLLGKTSATGGSSIKIGLDGGPEFTFEKEYKIESVEDLVGLDIVGYIGAQIKAGAFDNAFQAVRTVIQSLVSLGIKVPYSVFAGIKTASETMSIIQDFTGYVDYVYQYNAHAQFNSSFPTKDGNRRRRLISPARYIPPTIVSIDDVTFNNLNRESGVYLHLNKEVNDPITKDNTRNTATGFGIGDDINATTNSVGVAYYATSKVANPNQYGQLGSVFSVSLHSGALYFTDDRTTSPVLFGGDCIIARMYIQKKMSFFSQNMANTNYSDGVEYDYRLYRNIGYPRFWMDTTKYDFSELLNRQVVNFTRFNRTTASKHNLDNKKKKDGGSIGRIDDAYMYASNNCVLDFFVECDYNINFREKTDKPHFSKTNNNLSSVFRSDNIDTPEEFKLNRVYSDLYTTEIFSTQQRLDYTPETSLPIEQPNSVIYSLPSFNLQEMDNWQYFLPGNFFSFSEGDFGTLTAIHKLDQDRLIFMFSKSSPYVSMGRDFLELEQSGRKISIGDGGLFAQDPRESMPTDNNYGASTSRYAFSNTHLGRFYPSEDQGRIFSFNERLDDISRVGMSYWCKTYMPIFLYSYFPNYPRVENPVSGVGYLTVFDSFNETVYICKRDFVPKRELVNDIRYEKGQFYFKEIPISSGDSGYFDDVSWTLSYSPLDNSFVSWHDWHPDLVVQTDNHFMTVKGDTVYKHNERYDSFCNFYGKDYPFEVAPVSTSGQQMETVRSIEYILEVYKYKNFGRDRFHVKDENFSHLIVRNTEQISPLLNIVPAPKSPLERLYFPKKSSNISFDIYFEKTENKYRINQFWDSVKDRNSESHLFPTDQSGYKGVINPVAINIDKPKQERKKFRHYWNEFRFVKNISGENKFIFKITNIKKLISLS